jgi:hypothetical protein
MRTVLLFLPFALVVGSLSLVQGTSSDTTKPTKPFNVPCNTEDDEDDPHVSGDSMTLYYTRKKGDKEDILFVRRRSAVQTWPAKGKVIEDYVTTEGDDRSVCAPWSLYPRYLYFGSTKDRKNTNYDLFVAVQQGPGKAWSAPFPVMNVNTEEDELHPWLTSDGKSLYFSRKTKEGWRVMRSTRTGGTGPGGWQEPEQVDLPVNFYHATLTPDGRTMYLQGPLGEGRWGLFVSTRAGKGWSNPEPLEAVNDADGKTGDRSPNLTRDGRVLYFASDRPGGKGGLDLWGIPTAALAKKK